MKEALDIIRQQKDASELVQLLTENDFAFRSPSVYQRLWKEVDDRKIRNVALKYHILAKDKKGIGKILYRRNNFSTNPNSSRNSMDDIHDAKVSTCLVMCFFRLAQQIFSIRISETRTGMGSLEIIRLSART